MFEKGLKITVITSVSGPTERYFLDRLFNLLQKAKNIDSQATSYIYKKTYLHIYLNTKRG